MKKGFIAITLLTFLATPAIAGAHGTAMTGFDREYTPRQMMLYVEDEVLEDEVHEEMEELMQRMFEGDLTQEQADRLAQLMEDHPGPYSMMMWRMSIMSESGAPWSQQGMWDNHMSWGYGSGVLSWLAPLATFVWLVAGVLVVAWIIRRWGRGE